MSNRVLRELGWVQVKGNRDSPRNSDLKLAPEGELLALRKELMSLMKKDAAGFIKRIFHSEDDIWVDRCSSIIKE